MLIPFSLEAINDHMVERYWSSPRRERGEGKPPQKPWVAMVTGICSRYDYCRRFLDGKKDYRDANKRGSRGVLIHWMLDSDKVYEVQELRRGKAPIRYFIYVGDSVEEIGETEVRTWLLLNTISELTSLMQPERGSHGPSIDLPQSMSASPAAKTALSSCTLLLTNLAGEDGGSGCCSSTLRHNTA